MAAQLTEKEREEIIAHLEAGKSQNWTAKKVKRSKDTVGRIGREAGIESDGRRTKKATEAAAKLREIDRLQGIETVLRVGVSLIEQLEGQPVTPEIMKAFKDGVTGYAIGIDKHRLETGEVTDRTERVDPERRQRMRESLDEVAQRRREKLAG